MADIQLQKPTANQTVTLAPQAEDRLVFEFDSSEATLIRDGDSLVMSFEDGASLFLTDFYVAYTADNMPTFLIEGTEVNGEDFFAALGEELMPAAGNTTTAPQGSGSTVDTLAGTLLDGIDRLDGLDQAYPTSFDEEEDREGGTDADTALLTENISEGPANLLPQANADTAYVPEGGKVKGTILGNDDAGDTDSTHTGKDITSITPPAGWEALPSDILESKNADFGFYNPETGDIIIFDNNGNYEFSSSPDSTTKDTDLAFGYTIQDADGDTSESTLTITVGDMPTSSLMVDESDIGSKNGSKDSISKEAWLGESSLEYTEGTYPFYDDHGNVIGTATVNPDGSLSVTLTDNTSHDQGQNQHDDSITGHIDVTVKDANGNDVELRVNVEVKDDGPIATDNSNWTNEDGEAISGNLLANDSSGADGWAQGGGIESVTAPNGWTALETADDEAAKFESEAGTITFDKNGDYTFTPSKDYDIAVEKDFTFTYTAKDGDGDTDTADFTLTIKPEVGSIIMPEAEGIENTTALNLAVIVDSSGSMNANAMDQVEAALKSLGEKLDELSDGGSINICLIDYNKAAQVELKLEYDPESGKITDTITGITYDDFASILSTITWPSKGLEGTNMDAALNAATAWFKEIGNGDVPEGENFTILMTDGQPTYALGDYVLKDVLSEEALKGDNASLDPELDYVSNGMGYPSSFTFNGTTYNFDSFTLNDYNNTNLRNDAYVVYTDENGKTIVIVDDRGTSGEGFSYYEFDSKDDVIIDFNAGKITVTGGTKLDKTCEDAITNAICIDITGQSLNSAEDIANGKDGHTWTVDGITYRLVQSEAINGQAIEAPMLQVKNAQGIWEDMEQAIIISDGSGDTASTNEKEQTQESAENLNAAMGKEDGIFAIGLGANFNDSFLKTITVDGQVYTTDDLEEAFEQVMSVVAAKMGDELEKAIFDAMENVEGVNTTKEHDLLDTLLILGDEGKYDVLAKIGDAIDDVITTTSKDGLTLESGENITLGFTDQTLSGSEEDDLLMGFSGNDTITGGAGHDIIYGGAGDDVIYGGAGNDIIFGGTGDDILFGEAGDDFIFAGARDTVDAGSGNDFISLDNVGIKDLFSVDGGEGEVDLLLAGLSSTSDIETALSNGVISNVEVIVLGDDAEAAKELQKDLIENGSDALNGWTSGTTITGKDNQTYKQFTSDDDGTTILINTLFFS